MRLLLALILTATLPFAQAGEPEGASIDSAAIEQALLNWDNAWKTKDHVLAAKDYAVDADWTNAFGMTRKGKDQIEATLKEVFALPFVMAGDSQVVSQEIRFLDQGTALVRTRVERVGQLNPDRQALGTRHTNHLRVLKKADGQWRIVSHLISDARSTENGNQ